MFELIIKPAAERQMDRLPSQVRQRIVAALDKLRVNPHPASSAKLVGEGNTWRIRVGDYRVIYEVYGERLLILVVRVAHRKDVYRGL